MGNSNFLALAYPGKFLRMTAQVLKTNSGLQYVLYDISFTYAIPKRANKPGSNRLIRLRTSRHVEHYRAKFLNFQCLVPNLPQVPQTTMTGLRSLFDKFGNSKAEKTQAAVFADDLNLTMMRVDYDYHWQLGPWIGNRNIN